MARESFKDKRERALLIESKLFDIYGGANCALLYWNDPFKLTIAVMLSAQTTDKSVNKVTPVLWEKYQSIESLANAKVTDIEDILHSIGLYKTKARRVIDIANAVMVNFGGNVPKNMDDLQTLPGVGRKTANIVMNEGFGKSCGIAVDTHVFRIAHKLKLVPNTADTPDKTEKNLLKLFPETIWGNINHEWVLFGRQTCIARKPKCDICPVRELCPSKN